MSGSEIAADEEIATGDLQTRPFSAAASEILGFAFGLIGALLFPLTMFVSPRPDVASALRVTSDAGRVLLNHVDWAMSIYVTTLLGFYAVVIGGQILAGGAAARQTRRVLGGVAELMSAAAIILLACVAVYCFHEPQQSAVMIVLLPAVGIVFFLAAQLGRFLVAEREVRLKAAAKTRDGAQAKLDSLPNGSAQNVVAVIGLNTGAIALVATLLTWLNVGGDGDVGELAAIVGLYLAVTTLFACWNAYARHAARMADQIGRFAFLAITVVLYSSLGAVVLKVWSTASSLSMSFLLIGLASAGSALLPMRSTPRWLVNWSLGGASLRLTRRSLIKIHRRTAEEYDDLRLNPDSPLFVVPGWRRDQDLR